MRSSWQSYDDTLAVIVVRPAEDTTAALVSLGAMTVDDQPVSFTDAGYLGGRGEIPNRRNRAVAGTAGGV